MHFGGYPLKCDYKAIYVKNVRPIEKLDLRGKKFFPTFALQ